MQSFIYWFIFNEYPTFCDTISFPLTLIVFRNNTFAFNGKQAFLEFYKYIKEVCRSNFSLIDIFQRKIKCSTKIVHHWAWYLVIYWIRIFRWNLTQFEEDRLKWDLVDLHSNFSLIMHFKWLKSCANWIYKPFFQS